MLIHPKAPITWVEEGVIHVLCYRPGLVRKPKRTVSGGVIGLRGGRLFLTSETGGEGDTPEGEAGRDQDGSAKLRPAGPPPPPPLAKAATRGPA